jgi:hypothetical protein
LPIYSADLWPKSALPWNLFASILYAAAPAIILLLFASSSARIGSIRARDGLAWTADMVSVNVRAGSLGKPCMIYYWMAAVV